jgi:UDP-glucuronate 4-epimerase
LLHCVIPALRCNVLVSRSPERSRRGSVTINIGGGTQITVKKVPEIMERICGKKAGLSFKPAQKGDIRRTMADTTRAKKQLGYSPAIDVEKGLREEFSWIKRTFC